MIILETQSPLVIGIDEIELEEKFREYDLIRRAERMSILQFMEDNREYLQGKVLDFGSGTQPYKHLVSGEYIPFERGDDRQRDHSVLDCIMCNQVLQFIPDLHGLFDFFNFSLKKSGYLVITYATNWDEVEDDDLWRMTKAGMTFLLHAHGFKIIKHEQRAAVKIDNFRFPLGYGVVAQK